MNQYLNKATLQIWGYLLGCVIGLEIIINGFNLFSYLDTNILAVSVRELFAEIILLFSIFGGFLTALFKKDKKAVVLEYIQFLIASVTVYLFVVCRFALVPSTSDSVALLLNGTLISEPSMFTSKILIGVLGLLFLSVVYLDTAHNGFTALELPFLLGLTLWTFLFSLYCFNLLVLFLLMEAITLLIVVSNTLYFVFTGPKLVKPVVQFFILNLMISTFYLLGVALVLFMVPEQGAYTLSYASFWNAFESLAITMLDLSVVIIYFKLALGLILVPILFKLTLAPFSIWIVNVYANLPIVFLLVIMTIYKIVYSLLFLRLFLNVVDLVPELQAFWQNSLFIFVVPSMFIGCLAYRAQDLKTILAYTTVSQLGYIVAGFIVSSPAAIKYSLIYLVVYCLQLIGIFVIFLILQAKYDFTNLNQLFLVKKYSKFYYYLLFVIFFSLSGIPPLSGFFTKYFLFLQIYNAGFFMVAIFGLVSGFIMAIIYLQIVLQLMTVKPSHADTEQFEHNKKSLLLGEHTIAYNQVTFWLQTFLVVLFVFNVFFFFILPELSLVAGDFTYNLIYAGR